MRDEAGPGSEPRGRVRQPAGGAAFSLHRWALAGLRIRLGFTRIRPLRKTGSGSERQENTDLDPTVKKTRSRSCSIVQNI